MNTQKRILIAAVITGLAVALIPLKALAKTPTKAQLRIIHKAAERYNLDVQDLLSIAYTESKFDNDARRDNANGTVDVGMFQINTIHWDTTCKGLDITTLKGNAFCAAKLVAWLKKSYSDTDDNWLGRYHSFTPKRKVNYMRLLANAPSFEGLQGK